MNTSTTTLTKIINSANTHDSNTFLQAVRQFENGYKKFFLLFLSARDLFFSIGFQSFALLADTAYLQLFL